MKTAIPMLLILLLIYGCENNKGQYRHDPDHHDKIGKVKTSSPYEAIA